MPAVDATGRQVAAQVLHAASRGDHDHVAALIEHLEVGPLRGVVTALAAQVDQTTPPDAADHGPAAVCNLATELAAEMFATTPESILSKARSRTVSDARAVAITAARQTGLSYPSIARHFGKDHSSAIHAVRRTRERPRLEDAAARIYKHIQTRFGESLSQAAEDPALPDPDPVPTSSFNPSGAVEHAIAESARAFGTTPEAVRGRDESRAVADARAVAMTAARMRGYSLTRIAGHLDRAHTGVLHATRRIAKTPPLRELAAKIAATLPQDTAEPRRRGPEPRWDEAPTRPSRGAGEARHATGQPAPRRDRHLRAAR